MITAFGDVPLAVEAMKNGAEDFVTKPWDNDRLIETIRRAIIKNKASRRESSILTRASELEEKRRIEKC